MAQHKQNRKMHNGQLCCTSKYQLNDYPDSLGAPMAGEKDFVGAGQ
jgi:hypothetical protein